MAVLSFAHLRPVSKKSTADAVTTSTAVQPAPATNGVAKVVDKGKGKVLSFAHLKKSGVTPAEAKAAPSTLPASQPSPSPSRSTYSIPAILPTALLIATNYCRGCDRFWPSETWETAHGNPYGRCRRDDIEVAEEDDINGVGGWYEVWRVIPISATVERCWYRVQEKKMVVEL